MNYWIAPLQQFPMNNLRVSLIEIKELLITPDKWTNGANARNVTGQQIPPCSAHACQWCLVGAIHKVCSDPFEYYTVYSYLSKQLHKIDPSRYRLSRFNDELGFDAVHQLLDHAIQKTE